MKIVQTLFNRGDVEAAGRCFGPAFVDHVEHWDVIDEAGMARRLGIAA
jgi:predicted SnoaL-like aldol condensation-catalyzing enzyme